MKNKKDGKLLKVEIKSILLLKYKIFLFVGSMVGVICLIFYFFPQIKIHSNIFFYEEKEETIYIDMVDSDGITIIKPKKIIGNDVVFIFDIDDTLLHTGYGLSNAEVLYLEKIFNKELEKKHITPKLPFLESIWTTNLYIKTFLEHSFTFEEFWKWSDAFPFTNYVKRDEKTVNMIKWLKSHVRICAFTNAEMLRARIILESLGVSGLIETVITTTRRDKVFIHKPMIEAYSFVDRTLKILDKKHVYFFDDSINNIKTANKHGWNAYHTLKNSDLKDAINQALADAGITEKKYSDFGSLHNLNDKN